MIKGLERLKITDNKYMTDLRPDRLTAVSTYDHKNFNFFVIPFYLQSAPVK
jgi:hypothetical protein